MIKLIKRLALCLGIVTTLCLTSCVSSKKIIYFQGADDAYATPQSIPQQYQMKVKSADNLLVKITCSNPELLEMFASDVMMGSNRTNSYNMNSNTTQVNNVYGYTVDNEGYINLPQIGKVMVMGLTTEECATVIEQAIKDAQLISDPEVTVRLMNASVSVLGSVKNPGIIALSNERTSILDVIARAGDISDDGLKQNVRVFREINGERVMYTIDMTSSDIFNSPAFYVQQNDLVYVQPNKSKNIKNSAFYTWLSAGSSLIGIGSSLLSIVVVVRSLNK